MTDSVELRHGRSYDVGQGSVGVLRISNPAQDGQPLSVRVSVLPDGGAECRANLRVGDRFTVGAEQWVLREVRDPRSYDHVVVVDRA